VIDEASRVLFRLSIVEPPELVYGPLVTFTKGGAWRIACAVVAMFEYDCDASSCLGKDIYDAMIQIRQAIGSTRLSTLEDKDGNRFWLSSA
jgi:hypothetical protein